MSAKITLLMSTDDVLVLKYESMSLAKSDGGRLSRCKETGSMWRQRNTEFFVNPSHVITMLIHED